MSTDDLESVLGKFQAAYVAGQGKGKLIFNLILILIWLFFGWLAFSLFWDFYKQQGTAIVVGLVFLLSGLGFAFVVYRRHTGRKIDLHEEGVWLNIGGQTQSWRFDQLDGARVISGQGARLAEGLSQGLSEGLPLGGLLGSFVKGALGGVIVAATPVDELVGADINGYEFFAGKRRVVAIGPEYRQWKELGAAIYAGVISRLVPRLVGRLAQGEPIVFDRLTPAGFGKTRLTLTQAAIQEKEKPPVPWAEVLKISRDKQPGFVTLECSEPKKNITFAVDSAPNALVALQVIMAMVEQSQPPAN